MTEIVNILNTQEQELKKLQIALHRKLAKAPEGRVRVTTSHGKYNQYVYYNGSDIRYLGKNDMLLAKRLVQKKYDEDALKLVEDLLKRKTKFLNHYDYSNIYALYENLCPERKVLVTPILPSIDTYVENWLEEHPGNQNPYPPSKPFNTLRGEIVKSKSERFIANTLFNLGIPYQYEPKLELPYVTKYPDFIVLNKRTRKTYYWEHFGLTSEPDYSLKNWRKICQYENNGLSVGKDLIITVESDEYSLDAAMVQDKIEQYLL